MKKKIVFTLATLQGGGAEKVISSIALNIDKKKYEVIIVVFDLSGQCYLKNKNKNKNIKIINLKSKKVSTGIFNFIKTIRRVNPDILISSISHLNLFISLIKFFLPKKLKLVARESNFLSENIKFQSNYFIMKILYKIFYDNLDQLIVFSQKHKLDIIHNTNINYKKIKIIENPIDFNLINKLSKKKIESKYNKFFSKKLTKFVYVGSLSFQKGLDIFIKSLALVEKENFIFNIIGSGSEKNNLKKLVRDKKLLKKINFISFKKNPFPYIRMSDVFVMCSRFEGMSNTVLEALSLDKSILYLDNTGASTDLLRKSKNSYPIKSNDPFFISKKINQYKKSDNKISNYNIIKKLRLNNILRKYEIVLDDLF